MATSFAEMAADLQELKSQLYAMLVDAGVECTENEGLNTLIPKVSQVGGDHTNEDAILEGTVMESYYNDRITSLHVTVKAGTVELPGVTSIGSNMYSYIGSGVNVVKFKNLATIGTSCFSNSPSFVEAYFPSLKSVGANFFNTSVKVKLKKIYFGTPHGIGGKLGYGSWWPDLTTVVLEGDTMYTGDSTSFVGSVDQNENAYIYVRKALIEQYEADQYWGVFAGKFRAIEDYPEVLDGVPD